MREKCYLFFSYVALLNLGNCWNLVPEKKKHKKEERLQG